MLLPSESTGTVIDLCQNRRGEMVRMEYLSPERVELVYKMPLSEVVMDFFDALKSRTRGYASLDYEPAGFVAGDLVKIEILLNLVPVDAFSAIVHRSDAAEYGRRMTEKLRELIPRQLFDVPIQAAVGGRIVARETVKARRKDVLAKCYGGDITRKRKLLEKQKEGKKRMKNIGRVEVPQDAFIKPSGWRTERYSVGPAHVGAPRRRTSPAHAGAATRRHTPGRRHTPARRRPTSCSPRYPSVLEVQHYVLGGGLGADLARVDAHLGLLGRLVGVRDAGELLHDPCPRLGVEALAVAAARTPRAAWRCGPGRTRPAASIIGRTSWRTRLVGGDGRADGDAAVLGDLGGDPADAADVDVPVLLREAELGGEVLADDVAVEQGDRAGRPPRAAW